MAPRVGVHSPIQNAESPEGIGDDVALAGMTTKEQVQLHGQKSWMFFRKKMTCMMIVVKTFEARIWHACSPCSALARTQGR